jgi:hypothetical protein
MPIAAVLVVSAYVARGDDANSVPARPYWLSFLDNTSKRLCDRLGELEHSLILLLPVEYPNLNSKHAAACYTDSGCGIERIISRISRSESIELSPR